MSLILIPILQSNYHLFKISLNSVGEAKVSAPRCDFFKSFLLDKALVVLVKLPRLGPTVLFDIFKVFLKGQVLNFLPYTESVALKAVSQTLQITVNLVKDLKNLIEAARVLPCGFLQLSFEAPEFTCFISAASDLTIMLWNDKLGVLSVALFLDTNLHDLNFELLLHLLRFILCEFRLARRVLLEALLLNALT